MAFLLDMAILAIPLWIGNALLPVAGGVVVWFFYAPILESSVLRATLGKHLMGIQVADPSGRRISLRVALLRNGLKVVSTTLAFIPFVFALFTSGKQTLHDLLCDTFVVYGRSEKSVGDAWVTSSRELFRPEAGQPASALAELERLQDLREKGTLTEEEFEAEKRRILSHAS